MRPGNENFFGGAFRTPRAEILDQNLLMGIFLGVWEDHFQVVRKRCKCIDLPRKTEFLMKNRPPVCLLVCPFWAYNVKKSTSLLNVLGGRVVAYFLGIYKGNNFCY